jgi:AraC-like DNA-binding protein
MLGSVTGTFSEPEDFEAALRAEGCLLITGHGQFRAQLTRVELHSLCVSATDEWRSRIAFLGVPNDAVLLLFAMDDFPLSICGGVAARPTEIVTVGPGEQLHARTAGPSQAGAIWLPVKELVRYGHALTGAPFSIPPAVRRWHPRPRAEKDLRNLHAAAIRMAITQPQGLVDAESAHGLEQQLIHVAVECLADAVDSPTRSGRRRQDIMVRFERLLHAQPERDIPISEMCATLNVSERLLRSLCAEHLGMGPLAYDRLRRMSLVRRTLRRADGETSVAAVAERYGFRSPGRFAVNFRATFGESPSTMLRRIQEYL